MIPIKRALISVSDKDGLVDFARFLAEKNVEIISTGGTLKELQKNAIPAIAIDDYTGFPEILDGRVKTLHPKVHAGLLGVTSNPAHKKQMDDLDLESIDLVVVNLYPFVQTVQKPNVTMEEAIENIDIGGPSMLRSGAKNHIHTVVVTDVADYALVQQEMAENNNSVSRETSMKLAVKVFNHTAAYDSAIADYLNKTSGNTFPDKLTLSFTKKSSLRYGENPHQNAAYYEPQIQKGKFTQIQGKELSFNNMLDFDAAMHITSLMNPGTVCIIKHLNPCGIGFGKSVLESYELALKTDPVSAFGGVIGVRGEVDGKTAEAITRIFVEGVIAESFTGDALEIFAKKPNIRIIEIKNFREILSDFDMRQVHQGLLLQERDYAFVKKEELKVVTDLKPSDEDLEGLLFAWSAVKFVKSNAIVYTSKNATLGIGAGQMSRVDAAEIAAMKAKKAGLDLKGSCVGSDAFFPFRDGVDQIAATGAKAIIQPGGSIKDAEVIQAANEHKMIMVFTGMRHFRH